MSPSGRNRALIAAALAFVAFVVLTLVLPRPATDEGPDGTSTLRRLLEGRGVDLRPRAREPGSIDETFFVQFDLRAGEQVTAVLDWVHEGGRLVVADPASALLRRAGIRPGGVIGGIAPRRRLDVDCALPAAAGIGAVMARSRDATFRPEAGTVGCFGAERGWFLAERDLGDGTVVAVGGLTPFTNASLDDADDVVLAWNLLGRGSVAFAGPGDPPASDVGLWSLLPPAARAIAVQAALVAILFAVVRGRRMGRRPEEDVPSPIPASELVDARGELYRASRSAGHAAQVLRHRFRTRAGRRLGHVPDAGSLAAEVASQADRPTEAVSDLLSGPVADEGDLVRVAQGLERLERRLEGERA